MTAGGGCTSLRGPAAPCAPTVRRQRPGGGRPGARRRRGFPGGEAEAPPENPLVCRPSPVLCRPLRHFIDGETEAGGCRGRAVCPRLLVAAFVVGLGARRVPGCLFIGGQGAAPSALGVGGGVEREAGLSVSSSPRSCSLYAPRPP